MISDPLHRFSIGEALLLTVPGFVIGALLLRRSASLGRLPLLMFLLSIAYGLTLELLDIRTSEEYFYTDLVLMVGRSPNWAPVFIGVCWASILCAAMRTSDTLNLPVPLRPLFDGALGLSLDFILDPVASNSLFVSHVGGATCSTDLATPFGGQGLWTWCVAEQHGPLWYNVPLANFIGWFLMLALASTFLRLVRGPLHAGGRSLMAQLLLLIGAFAASTFVLMGSMALIVKVLTSDRAQWTLLALLYGGTVIAVGVRIRRLDLGHAPDWLILSLPAYVVIWEMGTFFVRGIDREHWPGSAVVMSAVAVLTAILWLLPWLGRLRSPVTTMRTP